MTTRGRGSGVETQLRLWQVFLAVWPPGFDPLHAGAVPEPSTAVEEGR
jgi:hypothetical protein